MTNGPPAYPAGSNLVPKAWQHPVPAWKMQPAELAPPVSPYKRFAPLGTGAWGNNIHPSSISDRVQIPFWDQAMAAAQPPGVPGVPAIPPALVGGLSASNPLVPGGPGGNALASFGPFPSLSSAAISAEVTGNPNGAQPGTAEFQRLLEQGTLANSVGVFSGLSQMSNPPGLTQMLLPSMPDSGKYIVTVPHAQSIATSARDPRTGLPIHPYGRASTAVTGDFLPLPAASEGFQPFLPFSKDMNGAKSHFESAMRYLNAAYPPNIMGLGLGETHMT